MVENAVMMAVMEVLQWGEAPASEAPPKRPFMLILVTIYNFFNTNL